MELGTRENERSKAVFFLGLRICSHGIIGFLVETVVNVSTVDAKGDPGKDQLCVTPLVRFKGHISVAFMLTHSQVTCQWGGPELVQACLNIKIFPNNILNNLKVLLFNFYFTSFYHSANLYFCFSLYL